MAAFKSPQTPWEPEIQKLEHRIGELAGLCNTLREENRELRGKVQRVSDERDRLDKKNQVAIESVQSLLSSVKQLEGQS